MMTVSQLRKEINELKEAAVKLPNLWLSGESLENEELKVREEMEELKEKIQRYRDMGILGHSAGEINLNWSDCIPTHIIQRWKNRDNLRIEEKIQLFRDIGLFN